MPPAALIAEPSALVAATLRKFLEGAGFSVTGATTLDEALERLGASRPALLVASCAPGFDGERLCTRARALLPGLPVVLVYPPDVEDATARADAVAADAAVVGPLKRANVVSVTRLVMALARARGGGLSPGAPAVPEPRAAAAPAAPHPDFTFIQRLMLMEVKRSRRYRYPTSILLVAVDPPREASPAPEAGSATPRPPQPVLVGEVLGLLGAALRDIDLAVPFTSGRILVYLPHTPLEGARTVAERLRARVNEHSRVPGLRVSVGVAGYEPGGEGDKVSFGILLKDAGEALKRAQASGGDGVESGAPSGRRRERISLT